MSVAPQQQQQAMMASAPQGMPMPMPVPGQGMPMPMQPQMQGQVQGAPRMPSQGMPPMQGQMQGMPMQQQSMEMQIFGNQGPLKLKHQPYDYEGKKPDGCCTTNFAYRVNTFVYGANNGATLYMKEDESAFDFCGSPCGGYDEKNANQTIRLMSSVDVRRAQELYRYETPVPTLSGCCPELEYQTKVVKTVQGQFKIVGDSRMTYKSFGCCPGYQDVRVLNKETGARYTVDKIEPSCFTMFFPGCSDGSFKLPVKTASGQLVGELVKGEDAQFGCTRLDIAFPTLHFQKRAPLSDDDQALIMAAAHQNPYMSRFFSFLKKEMCSVQLWSLMGYMRSGIKYW